MPSQAGWVTSNSPGSMLLSRLMTPEEYRTRQVLVAAIGYHVRLGKVPCCQFTVWVLIDLQFLARRSVRSCCRTCLPGLWAFL